MSYYHSTVTTPMRTALTQMLQEFDATHILTLAFHEHINMARAINKIAKWHHQIMRRLFGRGSLTLPSTDAIEFLLLPEAGSANLHFHGLVRVPPSHLDYFQRIAAPRWKRAAAKGTIDFQPLRHEDRDRWCTYITKGSLASEVLHSSMLLPTCASDGIGKTTNAKANLPTAIPPSP